MSERVGDIPADDGINREVPGRCKSIFLSHGGPAFKECLAEAWGVDVGRIRVWWLPLTDSLIEEGTIHVGVTPE